MTHHNARTLTERSAAVQVGRLFLRGKRKERISGHCLGPQILHHSYVKRNTAKRGKNLERKESRKRRSEAVKTEFGDDTASNKVNTKTQLEEKTQTHL